MDTKELLKKIKNNGYWEIHVHPLKHEGKIIETRSKAKEVVQNASVSLRGWDYPHLHDRTGGPYFIDNGVEKTTEIDQYVEFWRMTQSGNFYHLFALREDLIDKSNYRNIWSRGDELKDKKILGALGTLYTITEIFEFTKRLAKQGVLTNDFVVDIKLHDIYERHLYIDAQMRVPFTHPHFARTENPWVWINQLNAETIEDVNELSLKAYIDLVELFGWENSPVNVFKDDIQKFLEGKIW